MRSKSAAGRFLEGVQMAPLPTPDALRATPLSRASSWPVSGFPSSLFSWTRSWQGVRNTEPLAFQGLTSQCFTLALLRSCCLWHTEGFRSLHKLVVDRKEGQGGRASSDKGPSQGAVCKWLLGIASLVLEDHLASGPSASLTDGLGCSLHSPH